MKLLDALFSVELAKLLPQSKSPSVQKAATSFGEEIRITGHHEGRRDCCQGDRAGGSIREYGCSAVQEVASKTNDVAGDGTTTATVLAEAIVNAGLKNVAAGANPVFVKRGIDKAVAAAVEELHKIAIPVERRKTSRT